MANRATLRAVSDDRQYVRQSCATSVAIQIDQQFTNALIRNLSADGAMLDGVRSVGVGCDVQVQVPGCGWIPAVVVWAIDPRCGVAFRSRIDLDRVNFET